MTTDVLHSQSDSGSLSDDFSFLPEASSVQNGDINCHNDDCFNFTNMQSALCAAAAPSDSSVEIHSQLSEIIEENQRLKEQLNKNNSMMEDQINTIQAWRDHMLLSKNQMEENLKKANEQISYLTREKSELQERVDDLIKMKALRDHMIETQNTKSCMQCTALEDGLNDMLAIDKGKITEYLRNEWSYFRLNLQENLKFVCQNLEIQSENKTNQEEKLRLDCYISMLKYKLAFLERNADQLASLQTDEEIDYEVVRLKTHEGAAQQFHKVLEEFKQEVKKKEEELTRMENEKGELMEKINEYKTKLQEQEITSKSKYELLTHQLQNECSLSQKYRERCENLQKQIEEYETKLVECRARTPNNEEGIRLRNEIEELETILRLEQEAKEVEKEKYSSLMEKCEKLQVDNDRISKLLEIQAKDEKEKNENLSLAECTVKKYMEEVDHLTAKLLQTEERLEDCENKIIQQQSELEQVNRDGENVPLLKAQIDVYKRDYEQLVLAKNALSDELEKLKKENESSNSSSERHSSRSPGRRSSEQREQSGVAAVVQCPVCSLGFTTEVAVRNHITRCLEN